VQKERNEAIFKALRADLPPEPAVKEKTALAVDVTADDKAAPEGARKKAQSTRRRPSISEVNNISIC
jgi:hypothetical protein